MAEVESFTLDHTAVKAPYVRLINVESGPKGDQISNFDVRFVQPNSGEIPTSGLHTIEHLLPAARPHRRRHRLLAVWLPHGLPPHHVGHPLRP